MPHYDKRRGDLIIRIVYDGAPEAGKTTNVRQLSSMLSLQRRGEVASPGSVGRRTEFFDWMDFAGGYLDGRRLRCQLVTVPGQSSLLRRRRYLLETADAVIFVADSHPLLVEENRDAFASLRGVLERVSDTPVSIVLQANKQDRPNALGPSELAERMGIGARTPALGARAERGDGVKESFLLAVRLAADRVRALALRGAIASGAPEIGESPELLHELMVERERGEEPPGEEPPLEVAGSAPPPIVVLADEPSEAPAEPIPEPALASTIDVPAPPPTSPPTPPSPLPPPPLPDPSQIPAGCVWPPMTGRAVCASAQDGSFVQTFAALDWAPSDAVGLRSDRGLLAHTRPGWSWASLEEARVALLAEIRALLPVRDVLPEERAVVLGADGDRWRLWVITPDVATLADDLREAIASPDASDAALAERCVDAWRALRARLGPRAAPLRPSSVAKIRGSWVLLAFGDALDRPEPPLFAPDSPAPRVLASRLAETGAWPALHDQLGVAPPHASP